MESKKTTAQEEREALQAKQKVVSFFSDIKEEFGKITWTSKEELISYTKIVVGTTFVFGLMVYIIDLTIQTVLNGLSYFARMIGG
jgi:preprotein translocase subunit SecE